VFVSAAISGLTAFGDGILFMALWTALDAIGVLGGDHSQLLTRAAAFNTLMSIAPIPYVAWIARHEIRAVIGWGVLLATVAAVFVPLGVALLVIGNVVVLKGVVGGVFAVFGAARLWLSVRQLKTERHTIVHPSAFSTPMVVVETEPSPGPASLWKQWFPVITTRYTLRGAFVMLTASGVLTGVGAGLLGIGGPPQIAAFALMNLSKETQRGIRVLVIAAGGLSRLVSLLTASTSIYVAEDVPGYVGCVVSAVLGAVLGAAFRSNVSSEAILRMLYALLIVSTITLLDVLSRWYTVLLWCTAVVGYFAALWMMWQWPLCDRVSPTVEKRLIELPTVPSSASSQSRPELGYDVTPLDESPQSVL
jgi:uncharacterized membrane protein YfcA